MQYLVVSALLWLAAHLGLAWTGPRRALVRLLGEGGFRALYSVLAALTLGNLLRAYGQSPTEALWTAPDWLRWAVVALMLPNMMLLLGAFVRPNPTAVGGRAGANRELRGFQRITRHPMMAAVAVWSACHVAVNGDSAALLLFGSFFLTAALGMPGIDAKLRARDPAGWQNLAEHTSILPFGAILAGRNRLALGELGWLAPVLGLLVWLGLLHFHQALFGVAPLTFG